MVFRRWKICRTTILAAANPSYGRYNPYKSPVELEMQLELQICCWYVKVSETAFFVYNIYLGID